MELIGQNVDHQVFGTGVVTQKQGATMTVKFTSGEKRFIYPDAFTQFLQLQDQGLQNQILTAIQNEQEKAHQKELQAQAQWRREASLRNMHISIRAQAAFDVPPEKIQDCLTQWNVSAGTYSSGYSKGEPRVPDRIKPNSMCILTVRPEGAPESARQVFGMFMVPDTFDGSTCHDGLVMAHPEFRLALKEPVLFWPYVTQEAGKQKWGNTALKYLPNDSMETLLKDAKAALRGTEQGKTAADFYGYYCRVNRLKNQ